MDSVIAQHAQQRLHQNPTFEQKSYKRIGFRYNTMSTTEYTMDSSSLTLENRESRLELSLIQLKEIYVESLSPKEKKAYLIARDHLGMSFTLEKSVGFLQWKKTYLL